jgi:hypothetical protein
MLADGGAAESRMDRSGVDITNVKDRRHRSQ